jgi:hypothetical protein
MFKQLSLNGEAITLKRLLQDYTEMLQNFGLDGSTRNTTIKEILKVSEFGNNIGFHDRHE